MTKDPLAYGSDIPGARADLIAIAEELDKIAPEQADRIRQITKAKMTRRFSGRVAPVKHGLPKPWQIDKVKRMASTYTTMQQQEIGQSCGLNAGRVSEILSGLIYIDVETGDVKRRKRGEA